MSRKVQATSQERKKRPEGLDFMGERSVISVAKALASRASRGLLAKFANQHRLEPGER